MADQIAEFASEEEENHVEDAFEDEASEPEHADIPAKLKEILKKSESEPNLLVDMEDSQVVDIYDRVSSGYEYDLDSMSERMEKYKNIVNLAIMRSEVSDKTFPFTGASKVMMPALAGACIDFQSRTVPEICNKRNIVDIFRWGEMDDKKEEIGQRRSSAVNFQLKKGIKGWEKGQDRAMLILPMGGMFFKKTWWCCHKIQQSVITADKMIYDYKADSFEEAPRKSTTFTLDPNDYESNVACGNYVAIEALERKKEALLQSGKQPEITDPIALIESHCTLDLDGDGYCEPYIVTWSEEYDCVLRIEKRFNEDDVDVKDGKVVEITGEEFFTQYIFIPNPEMPAVGDGWGTLLYDALKALNTMYRQAIDASTLSIVASNSGFISSNLTPAGQRSKSGKAELILGQYTKVDMGGGQSMRDLIWTPQFSGVPAGFYQMLQDVREQILQFCAASQTLEVTGNEAASLYLGRLQQAMKVPNAVQSRVYNSVGQEAARIDNLLQRYLPEEEYLEVVDWHPKVPVNVKIAYQQALQMWQQAMQQWQAAAQQGQPVGTPPEKPLDPMELAMMDVNKQNDYSNPYEFITTADPTLGSYEERIARKEMIANRAIQMPQLYNLYETEKDLLLAVGECSADRLLVEPTGQPTPQEQMTAALTQAEIASIQADAQHKSAQAQKAQVTAQLEQMKAESEIDLNISNVFKNLAGIDAEKAKIELASLDTARKDLEVALQHLYKTGDMAQGQMDREHQLTMQANDHAHRLAMQPSEGQDSEPQSDQHEQVIVKGHPKHGDVKLGDILHTANKRGISPLDVLNKIHGVS